MPSISPRVLKKPESPEEWKNILAEKMKTSPCHKCGELGHWSRECPQKGHATGAASCKSLVSNKSIESEWATLAALCGHSIVSVAAARSGYKVRDVGAVASKTPKIDGSSTHDAYWCQSELRLHLIVDLGCVKSVVGLRWTEELVREWQKHGRWFRLFPEKEVFQFGNGQSL